MAGLGRGLSSLIPPKNNQTSGAPTLANTFDPLLPSSQDAVLQIEPSRIKANSQQPRRDFDVKALDELAASLKEYGVLQPLVVQKSGTGYELIAGERRLRAAKLAGLKTVPVIVRSADEQHKLELALIENIQREDLNLIELGQAYQQLVDEFKLTQAKLAAKVGKPSSTVANTLRYLKLPDEIQRALVAGDISEGHAKIIVGLDTAEKQLAMFRKIRAVGLTVEDTIKASREIGGTKQARVKINYADQKREATLREFFQTKVEIKRRHNDSGQILIDFGSEEELLGMLKKIK